MSLLRSSSFLLLLHLTCTLAGQHKLAWVKIGLAIRVAQSLHLANKAPDTLTQEQQLERTLTFWSVYLLDRLVSCGLHRPPTINDGDCDLSLPTSAVNTDEQMNLGGPTLQTLDDVPDAALAHAMGDFAGTIFMASALGRIEKCFFQRHYVSDPYPPWHARSQYMATYSLLLSFETYSAAPKVDLAEALDQLFESGEM